MNLSTALVTLDDHLAGLDLTHIAWAPEAGADPTVWTLNDLVVSSKPLRPLIGDHDVISPSLQAAMRGYFQLAYTDARPLSFGIPTTSVSGVLVLPFLGQPLGLQPAIAAVLRDTFPGAEWRLSDPGRELVLGDGHTRRKAPVVTLWHPYTKERPLAAASPIALDV